MTDDGMTLEEWELKLAETNLAISQVLKSRSHTMDEVTYSRESLAVLQDFQKECRDQIRIKKELLSGKTPGPKVFNVVLAE